MTKSALITGGGTGIGKALVLSLVEQGITVTIVGRRLEPLIKTQQEAPSQIHVINADISTSSGREKVIQNLPSKTLHYVIHNAGILGPTGSLENLSLEKWRQTLAINVEGPLFLTQQLLPYFVPGGRLLHLSSLWAHQNMNGFMAYCTSKAALFMVYQHLRDELKAYGIHVGSVMPGPVDTAIQEEIRNLPPHTFAEQEEFNALKTQNLLVPPTTCAAFLSWLLLATDDNEFSSHEWDIYDTNYHPYWLKHFPLPML